MTTVPPDSLTLDEAVRPISGVYSISDPTTGKTYVGQSRHVLERLFTHRRQLTSGNHPYQKVLGAAHLSDTLRFAILERVADPQGLLDAEQYWMDRYWTSDPLALINPGRRQQLPVSPSAAPPAATAPDVDPVIASDRVLGQILGERMGVPEQNRDAFGELIFGAVRRSLARRAAAPALDA